MSRLKKGFRQLFFYSSRQLFRRKRAYTSIFVVAVVLLVLVMTFLELCESYLLRDLESGHSGMHHASIRCMTEDFSDEILRFRKVDDVMVIPYTSLLASSDDASRPARVVVETDEIDKYLNVRYVWGHAPAEGEIAVSADLIRAYGWLEAGVENELFFTASQMTYFPLTVSGIYECSDGNAGYVFVAPETVKRIDRETGAKTKYDFYIRCRHPIGSPTNRYVAKMLDEIRKEVHFPDTEYQKRYPTTNSDYKSEYRDYLNSSYMLYMNRQYAIPTVGYTLPVILAAALMLASFMANWTKSHSPEYGVLGAIGANRRQLCAITSGQILLIAAVAAIPVVLLSAALSGTYISAYNAADTTDVNFAYVIPWGNLIKAALWFVLLSVFFTYLGVARLAGQMPFLLISGAGQYRIPFVKRSDTKLWKKKDRILALGFLRSLREYRSAILPAIITSLICSVFAVILFAWTIYHSAMSTAIFDQKSYTFDMSVSVVKNLTDSEYNRSAALTDANLEQLRNTPGIAEVGIYESTYDYSFSEYTWQDEKNRYFREAYVSTPEQFQFSGVENHRAISCDPVTLPYCLNHVTEGDPDSLFTGENRVIFVSVSGQLNDGTPVHAGDTLKIAGMKIYSNKTGSTTYDNVASFTVAAVVQANRDIADFTGLEGGSLIFTREGYAALGFGDADSSRRAVVRFDEGLTDEEMLAVSENLSADPAFMRFAIENHRAQTQADKRIEAVTTGLLVFFFVMVYLAFLTMTYVNGSLKTLKIRSEIAVMRQMGADGRDIQKLMRVETYLIPAAALCLTVVIFLGVAYGYASYALHELYVQADMYPLSYPPEVIAQYKSEIFGLVKLWLGVFAFSVPLHLFAALTHILGVVPPTHRLLRESITEGLRKDTD